MIRKTDNPLGLKMPVGEAFVPLASAFAAHGARGLGLIPELSEELALATEEVVAYLVLIGMTGEDVRLTCRAGSYFVEVEVTLPARRLQLRALNLTAKVNAEDDACLDQMGLLIASRMTDRFRVSRPSGGNLLLSLIKEFSYPEIKEETRMKIPGAISEYTIKQPDPAQIKWFVRLVNRCLPAASFPIEFRYPGKIADMAAGGDYHLLLAVGSSGEIGGGIAWKWEGAKTATLFGPYIFLPEGNSAMAEALLEACIGSVARTSALVLASPMPSAHLPEGYLEALSMKPFGGSIPRFRMMHEDTGAAVFAHPEVIPFLEGEYARLVFPRDIREVTSDGEAEEAHSVLSAEMDRRLGKALLRPIWFGADADKNLAEHVALMRQEGMTSVSFEMDLGISWQAGFTPGLLHLGFEPRMIVPHAGMADMLLFELRLDP